ncbi:SpoIIE family protein phosphatase [Streptomyces specialis]|uniref:SpoIIE family protein phosphatase n=1 Tax=Streptomyces specialis TaxID=498367 RepID=UPI000A499EFE
MSGSDGGGPGGVRAERLRLLAAVDTAQGDVAVLTVALQHAAADLGALGAMAHVRAGGASRIMYLVASTGLPRSFTRFWENIQGDGSSPPARAVREDRQVWVPEVVAPEPPVHHHPPPAPPEPRPEPGADTEPFRVPAGAGVMTMPLSGTGGPLGALSVVTRPDRRPDEAEVAFLAEVARLTGERLRLVSPAPENLSPDLLLALQTGPGPREALKGVPVASFEWDLRTGELAASDSMRDMLDDMDPDALEGRIEAWVATIHPDDLPWVLTEVDRGIRADGAYEVEHRVRRRDGSYRWVRIRGRVADYEDGRPVRVVGTTTDTDETHAALEPVGRALRHMSDGFLSLDRDWRVGFVNLTAERLLESAQALTGRSLWDIPVMRRLDDGLEQRCRRAAAEGDPAGFDVRWPGTDRWYHLRLVPVPDGLTVYIIDITERRLREAAQKAAAERDAVIGDVTRALAEAVTARQVVRAVAGSVLPPFGATGLVVLTLDADRLHLVDAVGYPPAFRERLHGSPALGDTPVDEVLRTRAPRFVESPEALVERYPRMAEYTELGGKKAWAYLPLVASGDSLGAAVVSFDRPRRLTEDERALLAALSGLIAQALERASLYDEASTRARELQRGLLPRALPSLPAVTTAARYLPAGQGTEVGGDWYDVIPLSADRVALVIGDVMGHGMSEAATMGRLRTAVRALSDLELPPDEILAHLNDIVADLGEDYFATCLYGVYDPVTRDFSYARPLLHICRSRR